MIEETGMKRRDGVALVLAASFALLQFTSARAEEWQDVVKDGVLVGAAENRNPPDGTGTRVEGNGLVTFDQSTSEGGFIYLSSPVEASDGKPTLVAEFKVRVVSGLNGLTLNYQGEAVAMRLLPNEINFKETKQKVAKETADAFHTYRLTLSPGNFKVEMDDEVIIEGKAVTAGGRMVQGKISFGSGNSGQTGEAIWENVRYRLE